jgi:hypothetical protein
MMKSTSSVLYSFCCVALFRFCDPLHPLLEPGFGMMKALIGYYHLNMFFLIHKISPTDSGHYIIFTLITFNEYGASDKESFFPFTFIF